MSPITDIEFRAWPKIPRLNRGMVVTEKIDGSNAAVIVIPSFDATEYNLHELTPGDIIYNGQGVVVRDFEGELYVVAAQSRKRVLAPGKSTDNFGFAGWVRGHAQAFADALGPGYHYGEWWGLGIQRGYGQTKRRFSLFNVARYATVELPEDADLVPVLYEGIFDNAAIDAIVAELRRGGSLAAPGQPAEGVVVFHTASRSVYKVLCENDGIPKGQGGG